MIDFLIKIERRIVPPETAASAGGYCPCEWKNFLRRAAEMDIPGKRWQAPFAGTALRVLRTKGACHLFPKRLIGVYSRDLRTFFFRHSDFDIRHLSDSVLQRSRLLLSLSF